MSFSSFPLATAFLMRGVLVSCPNENSAMTTTEIHLLLDRFATFLRVEKSVSSHTLRNYMSDLAQFFSFVEQPHERAERRQFAPTQIDHHLIHAYLSLLHRRNKKSSIGRKLSTLKSF